MTIEQLKAQMELIAGAWNGDEAGIQEDNAHIAEEVLEHIKEIEELLTNLN